MKVLKHYLRSNPIQCWKLCFLSDTLFKLINRVDLFLSVHPSVSSTLYRVVLPLFVVSVYRTSRRASYPNIRKTNFKILQYPYKCATVALHLLQNPFMSNSKCFPSDSKYCIKRVTNASNCIKSASTNHQNCIEIISKCIQNTPQYKLKHFEAIVV